MKSENLIKKWFEIWENGNFKALPILDSFIHTSPYGTITGREKYIQLVENNKDQFLGHKFVIHDQICSTERSCVRYTALQGGFKLEVTEWHWFQENKIAKVIAYYNIEEKRIEID